MVVTLAAVSIVVCMLWLNVWVPGTKELMIDEGSRPSEGVGKWLVRGVRKADVARQQNNYTTPTSLGCLSTRRRIVSCFVGAVI